MIPAKLPKHNSVFGPPEGMDESQVSRIQAYTGTVRHGNLDGAPFVVVGWKPSPSEIEEISKGGVIYLSVIGLLPPHFLTTNFGAATNGECL